jgi:branched-chain amino acid aminotransferase
MIHRHVFHNGKLLPIEDVRLSPGQAGLMTGWGLFTTLRIFERVPFAFERHWHRLSRDAERTRCPFPFVEEAVGDQMEEVLRANDVVEGCARIYVIYNHPSLWRSDEKFPVADLLLCSSDLPAHHEPVRLAIREHGRHAGSPLAGVKVTSWLNNVWCLQEAQEAGFGEVVLLNERGEVAECTAANIFCVREGRVLTPPLSSGCLPGVTREVLLEIGARAGIAVEERTLLPEDLYSADEVFISSTNRNVISVEEIAGRKMRAMGGAPMRKLGAIFSEYVREYVDAHAAVGRKQ